MERILKKIKVVGDCWVWQGCVNTDGYAHAMRAGKRNIKVHRYMYEHYYEPIPKGLVVRHKCDNPLCINPEHLELGTQQDNVADRVKRGRSHNHVSEDEAEQVLSLRNNGLTYPQIARELGIKRKRVEYIVNKFK